MDMIGNERRMDNFLITNKAENAIWVDRLEKQVNPHFLDGTEYKGALLKKREALAQWMTDKSNPYFSQAIVNRIWKHLYGARLRRTD